MLSTRVAPGKRVVWKVTATNTSVGVAENVIIYENSPAFTQLATGTAIAGNPKINGTDADPKQVKVDGNKITFYVGDGADNTLTEKPGGNLGAGVSVETTFEVEIE